MVCLCCTSGAHGDGGGSTAICSPEGTEFAWGLMAIAVKRHPLGSGGGGEGLEQQGNRGMGTNEHHAGWGAPMWGDFNNESLERELSSYDWASGAVTNA